MRWTTSLLAVAGAADAMTMLRFGCTNIVVDRLDPLVNPGQVPATHMHQIMGGNHFNATMTTGDVSEKATCTSCIPSEDFSNYWTANLYFRHPNGTFKRVKQRGHALQFGDRISNSQKDGTLVYYAVANVGKTTAFKPGFRMLVGDAARRELNPGTERQNCFRCYTGPNYGGDTGAPCMDNRVDTPDLPKKPCAGGIRTNVAFPTCWDGKTLDTPNHQDHVAYPVNGPANFLANPGRCPDTHPVQIPQLMYEVVWDTTEFNDQSLWPTDGSQPFWLSMGDNTGYGQHGDYVFGWKGESLQNAINANNCFGASCTEKTQSLADMEACKVSPQVNEDVDGFMEELPNKMS